MRTFGNDGTHQTGRTARLCALALVAVLVMACDDSGPVDDVFLFEGQVTYQGSQTHSLVSRDEGIARFEVLALTPRLLDVTFGANIVVGLGVGRPNGGECATSFRANARAGTSFSIGLEEETEYCVRIFDPGTLPEDALIDYTVSVSPG